MQKAVKLISFNLIIVMLIFLLFEGVSSIILTASEKPLSERRHTQYDELLGWINIPNIYIRDMYGPGIYLKTNSQGFRNKDNFTADIPDNKARIICSGDSFTLGYGVDNDNTWCQKLVLIDNRLETVNMGQGGYGIDQAYLWYERDGIKLEHDIHIFAFITIDFLRMQSDKLYGYGKPVLKLQDGVLVTKGTPVPKRSYITRILGYKQKIKNLQSTMLLQKLFSEKHVAASTENKKTDNTLREVVLKVFADLHQTNQQKGSSLVLVYLPNESYGYEQTKAWRQFLHEEAAKNNLLLIDLYDEFLKLPHPEVERFFIHKNDFDPNAAGHYTEEGNAYIAEMLYKKLLSIPELSEKIRHKHEGKAGSKNN